MQTPNGYKFQTTLVEDFQIASAFGAGAVRDTYKRIMRYYGHDIVYLTEMYIALNWEMWRLYEKNEKLAQTYQRLWDKLYEYVYETFKDDEAALRFFYEVTD